MVMNFSGVGRELTAVSRYACKSQETADVGSGFLKLLEKMGKAENPSGAEVNPGASAEMSKSDIYQQYLKQKYGNVMIQNVENNQKSIDKIGAGTAGTNNVVIAPTILEQMARKRHLIMRDRSGIILTRCRSAAHSFLSWATKSTPPVS